MHKKPIYSFENKNSTGVNEVPLLSIMSIEDTSGLSEFYDDTRHFHYPAFIVVLDKQGVSATSTVEQFIAIQANWMEFYSNYFADHWVKKTGDTMSGNLDINASLDVSGNIWGTTSIGTDGSSTVGKYFVQGDYDEPLSANKGVRTYVRDSVIHVNHRGSETETIKMRLGGLEVLTTDTGVMFDDWAGEYVGGIIKVKRIGNTLWMTTDGSHPGPI
jgi:hypothetical protein